ncbi:polysaccharide deacetylase family protein [Spirulina subsalsa FACHB-351]|uniref:Polysaccharide deacetylase family protein n=1 Tax=Spirulina subsalsa FACHB-351 TaxID=234711 RepID=A0ABT3L0H2_9CYAN|nr:polysaccharide deacetylase family protein [Spirulina subsalsa]MCW6035003.1 polysaccharide deacetylase family protein [Spirulina subsalsa FACHB-351]
MKYSGRKPFKVHAWGIGLLILGGILAVLWLSSLTALAYLPIRPLVGGEGYVIPPMARGQIIRQVELPDSEKAIALTFDDGPTPQLTAPILDILQTYHVPATFFWVGQNVQRFPALVEKAARAGHTLGNHTWHHPTGLLTPFRATQEVESTRRVIYQTIGRKTPWFRPPFGHLHNGLVSYARSQNDTIILWSVDSEDWRVKNFSVAQMVEQVLSNIKPGAIVLFHDGRGSRLLSPTQNLPPIVQALPLILEALHQQGYHFVTVPQLLQLREQTTSRPSASGTSTLFLPPTSPAPHPGG